MSDTSPRELRAKRVSDFWNWLPAFRAVAESEHLPTAAARLGVSGSALSRTVKLLEEDVGADLFQRIGRRIVLNERGRVLLTAVREAMRRVDDGYQLIQPGTLRGRVLLSGRSTHVWLLVPAIARMQRDNPQLMPAWRTLSDGAVARALREGSLDVALVDRPIPEQGIVVERLTTVEYGIYCGQGHPLHGRPDTAPGEILAHAFVTPPSGVTDNWPPEVRRIVGAEVDLFHSGVRLAESGAFLALLPRPMADDPERSGRLFRLDYAPAAPLPLYAAFRQPVGTHPLTTYVLDVFRSVSSFERD